MEVWKRFCLIFFIPLIVTLCVLKIKQPSVTVTASKELSESLDKKSIQSVLRHMEKNYETVTLNLRIKEITKEQLKDEIDREVEYIRKRGNKKAADLIALGKVSAIDNIVAKYSFFSREILLVTSNLKKLELREGVDKKKVLLKLIIHEMMHQVQNKHVSILNKITTLDDIDELFAYLSILEGHAQYFMKLFMADVFSEPAKKLKEDDFNIAEFKYTYGEKYFNSQAVDNQQLWRLPDYLKINTYELIHNIPRPIVEKKGLPVNLMKYYERCQVQLDELSYPQLYLYYKSIGMSDNILKKIVDTETQVISCGNKVISISRIYTEKKYLRGLLKDLEIFSKKQLVSNNSQNSIRSININEESYLIEFNVKGLDSKGAIYRVIEGDTIIEIFVSPLLTSLCSEPIALNYDKLKKYCLNQ